MATIKDIAHLAGVSQGTVSHVLNGKGIVSSEKIKLVEKAALELGYIINERAKILRQGRGKILAAVLPNIQCKQYVDFYVSFKAFVENQGYSALQYLSDDNPDTEQILFSQIRSGMAAGVAVFSSLRRKAQNLMEMGFSEWEVLFVERDQDFPCNYIGFDYKAAGTAMASLAREKQISPLVLVTDNPGFSNEEDFSGAFMAALKQSAPGISCHVRSLFRGYQSAIEIFEGRRPQGVFITNYGFARIIHDIRQTLYPSLKTSLATLSPLFAIPDTNFMKYELNYRLMGKLAAQHLIENIETKKSGRRVILENTGFRQWYTGPAFPGNSVPKGLHVLTLESPAADAMKHLSPIFTQATGMPVHVSIFSYDEIHEVLNSMGKSSIYDVIRLDVTWLSWFAPRLLRPLEEIDPAAPSSLERFINGLNRQYFFVEDTLYALPSAPSNQILFYRKDLFESTVLKRLYQETYKIPLAPPLNFAEYNRIARFFTKAENPESPIDFGTTLTLGSTGVAATEFLTRYLSYTDSLFTDDGRLCLTGKHALRALKDLMEARAYSNEPSCVWWTNAAQEFSGGNIAMTILYSNFASDIFGRGSRVINKVGYAIVPGRNPIIGGGSMGVSKFSKHPREALAYINWICDEPVSSARTLLGSVPSCKESFNNYEIIEAYPWLELSKECFAYSSYRRTPSKNNAPFDDRGFLSIIGQEIKNALGGAVSPEESLEHAQKQYEETFPLLLGGTEPGRLLN
jgi:multiple sugar transport system substrate-binding protein